MKFAISRPCIVCIDCSGILYLYVMDDISKRIPDNITLTSVTLHPYTVYLVLSISYVMNNCEKKKKNSFINCTNVSVIEIIWAIPDKKHNFKIQF